MKTKGVGRVALDEYRGIAIREYANGWYEVRIQNYCGPKKLDALVNIISDQLRIPHKKRAELKAILRNARANVELGKVHK